MEHSGFQELLALLNSVALSNVVVGGYALKHRPSFTGDSDLFIKPDSTTLNDFTRPQ